MKVKNGYRYVSDQGTATFMPDIQGGGQVAFDGNLRFATEPGMAGTLIDWSGTDTVSASSVGGPATLPAFAANGSTDSIGTWTLPQGEITSKSPNRAVTLQLAPDHLDFSGAIRPLKVALNDPGNPQACMDIAGDCIATLLPLTLASSADTILTMTSETGTVYLNSAQGSCINGINGQGGNGGRAEATMNVCRDGITVSLIDDTGAAQATLPMEDASGATVGTWSVSDDETSLSWALAGPVGDVLSINPVKYRVEDIRNESWSGWFNQTIPSNSEPAPQTTTYDTASIITEFPASEPASAAGSSGTTSPNTAVSLSPVYSPGSTRGVTASIASFTILAADPSQGTWTANPDGTILFSPTEQASGQTSSAVYTVTSSNGTSASGELTVAVAAASSSLALDMTVDESGLSHPTAPGEPVTFRYVVTNTGDLTLSHVSLTNGLAGVSDSDVTWPATPGQLAPGATATATATYKVNDADIARGSLTNTATASGNLGDTVVLSDSRSATVTLTAAGVTPDKPKIPDTPKASAKGPELAKTGVSSPGLPAWGAAALAAMLLGGVLLTIRRRPLHHEVR